MSTPPGDTRSVLLVGSPVAALLLFASEARSMSVAVAISTTCGGSPCVLEKMGGW